MPIERKITVEFTRPTKFFPVFSWIIRLIEKTEYSHVRLKWVSSTGIEVIYEASGTNIKFKGPLAAKNTAVVVKSYDLIVDNAGYKRLVFLCMTYAGLEYGLVQLLGILLVKVFRLKKNPLSRGKKSQVCSELVGRFLEEVMGCKTGLDLDTAGVRDIEKVLNKQKDN